MMQEDTMKNEINNIIFTKDGNYAYNLRNKLEGINIKAGYVKDMEALLYFMFKNEKGIIFLDLKYARCLPIIKEYLQHQSSRNYCFICLTDNKSCEVECDNKSIFVADFENIIPVVKLAIKEMEIREKIKFAVPDGYVDCKLSEVLYSLNISSKHLGYELIKDAIKIMLNIHTRPVVFMKDIYQQIADIRGKEPANVEKSIRLALDKAEECNLELYKQLFNNQKVSNTIILNYINETIKNSYYTSREYKSMNNL